MGTESLLLRTHRTTLVLLIVALALRGGMVLASLRTAPMIDMIEYEKLADGLMRGEGYRTENGPTAFRPPLYPVFIAGARSLLGDNPASVRIAQALLGAATCLLTMMLGAAVAGPKAGRVAGLIMAVYPPHIVYTSYVHREILFTFLVTAALVTMLKGDTWRALLSGVVLGLAALTNSLALAMILAASVALAVRGLGRRALLVAVGGVLTVLPWTARNYAALRGFVPVNTKTGVVLWEGNDEGWLKGETEWDIRSRHWKHLQSMDELRAHRYGLARATEFVRSNPTGFLYLCWRRFIQFWRVDLLFYFYLKMGYWGRIPTLALLAISPLLLLAFPILVLAAILGVAGLGQSRGPWAVALAIGSIQVLLGSLFVGGFRYHFPIVPLLAVAASAASRGLTLVRSNRTARALVVGVVLLACFNWVDQAYANRHQIRQILGIPGGKFDDHLTRSWMKRGLF